MLAETSENIELFSRDVTRIGHYVRLAVPMYLLLQLRCVGAYYFDGRDDSGCMVSE